MQALLMSQREVDERTVHPVRQFYDLFTKVGCSVTCPFAWSLQVRAKTRCVL